MIYLISILASLALFVGFIVLTAFETKCGRFILPKSRAALDAKVARGAFVARHVDWGAFTSHIVREGAALIAHDIAHTILVSVRFVERVLSRTVRALRERRAEAQPRAPRGERMTLRTFVRSFRKRPEAEEE